jgi:hypothetical protein
MAVGLGKISSKVGKISSKAKCPHLKNTVSHVGIFVPVL